MKNNRWAGIAIVAIILLGLIIAGGYFLGKKRSSHRLTNWTPEYRYDAFKDPFDVDVTHELLISAVGDKNFHTLPDTGRLINVLPSGKNNTYFYIGESYDLTDNEEEALREFISRGNDVFIVTEKMNSVSQSLFFMDENDEGEFWDLAELLRSDTGVFDSFTLSPIGRYDTSILVHWSYFLNQSYRKLSYISGDYYDWQEPSGELEELQTVDSGWTCFVRRKIGEGQVYVHTIPLVFSNIYMKDERFFHHLNGLLDYVKFDKIYWDNHQRNFNVPEPAVNHESEFRYIVSQPELRYALYLAIFGVILYVLFAMKRVQRPIPIIDSNRNTSIQSLKMVSRLFYIYPDHVELSHSKMTVFLHFIRTRYGLIIGDLDEEFYEKLSRMSGVKFDLVRSIFRYYGVVKSKKRISSTEAILFVSKINRFYKNCK